tara:strand:+ start:65 stop:394 length:330 start_codon:yes stop_codon:yes gene_type:complete
MTKVKDESTSFDMTILQVFKFIKVNNTENGVSVWEGLDVFFDSPRETLRLFFLTLNNFPTLNGMSFDDFSKITKVTLCGGVIQDVSVLGGGVYSPSSRSSKRCGCQCPF